MNFRPTLPSTPTLAERFTHLTLCLQWTIAKLIGLDRSAGPVIVLVYNRLTQLHRRFAAIANRFQAGTLPPPRKMAPRTTPRALPVGPRLPRMPRTSGFGWTARLMPGFGGYGGTLDHMVRNDPEMAAVIAASPEAARIVRSVFWMTGWRAVPEVARRPRTPRVPRVRAPKPPREPAVRAPRKRVGYGLVGRVPRTTANDYGRPWRRGWPADRALE